SERCATLVVRGSLVGVYHNAPLKKFVAEMSRWYGIKVENMDCIPDGPRITAAVDYQAPLYEIYAHIYKAGVFIYEGDGMISFCNPKMNPNEPQLPGEVYGGDGSLAWNSYNSFDLYALGSVK